MKKRAIINLFDGRLATLEGKLKGLGTGNVRDQIVSFQTDVNNLHSQVSQKLSQIGNLDTAVTRLTERMAEVDDMASKLGWLHERVDLLATRLENMRGNVTLDDGAAKRLTFAVGQFSARLDRLEQPMTAPPPPKPRRKRKPNGDTR
jgi:flagellar biosynthesis chaperone FliJ